MEKKELIILGSTAVAGLAIGFGVGYFTIKGRIQKKADADIESVKENYRILHKEDEYATPEEALIAFAKKEAAEATTAIFETEEGETVIVDTAPNTHRTNYQAPQENAEALVKETVVLNGQRFLDQYLDAPTVTTRQDFNVFDTTQPDDSVLTIETNPDPENPYLISFEEWVEDEFDHYQKLTITYWEGDNVLADTQEKPIPDIRNTVGEESLNHFGERSRDENIVYVRNERLEIDFEIVLDKRDYAEVVHGIQGEERARSNKPLRMRDDD